MLRVQKLKLFGDVGVRDVYGMGQLPANFKQFLLFLLGYPIAIQLELEDVVERVVDKGHEDEVLLQTLVVGDLPYNRKLVVAYSKKVSGCFIF